MTNGTGRRHMPAARTTERRADGPGAHGGGARDARLVAAVRERDDPSRSRSSSPGISGSSAGSRAATRAAATRSTTSSRRT